MDLCKLHWALMSDKTGHKQFDGYTYMLPSLMRANVGPHWLKIPGAGHENWRRLSAQEGFLESTGPYSQIPKVKDGADNPFFFGDKKTIFSRPIDTTEGSGKGQCLSYPIDGQEKELPQNYDGTEEYT